MSKEDKSYDSEYEGLVDHIHNVFPVMYLMDVNFYSELAADSVPDKGKLNEYLKTLRNNIMKIPENAQRLIVQEEIREQVEKVAETLGQEEIKKFYGEEIEKFPEFAEALDKKEIAGAFLKQKDLNIYQLRMCLHIAPDYVGEVLKNFPEVKERVNKLLEDPKQFKALQTLKDNETLGKCFNMKKLAEQTLKKLQRLSGAEVCEVFMTEEKDVPAAREAAWQEEVLKMYLQQTSDLTQSSRDCDLFYGSKGKDPYWQNVPGYLQAISTFKGAPEITAVMEERIIRILSLYTIPEAYGEDRSHFSYFATGSHKRFAENMQKEVVKNPDSHVAQFYLQNAMRVLDQFDCTDYYLEAAEKLLPQMAKAKRFDICKHICKDMMSFSAGSTKRFDTDTWMREQICDTLENDGKSAMAKFYQENLAEICGTPERYLKFAEEYICERENPRKDVCEQICKEMHQMAMKREDTASNSYFVRLCKLYEKHPNAYLEEMIDLAIHTKKVDAKNLVYCYNQWQKTGLKSFEFYVDKVFDKIKAEAGGKVKEFELSGELEAKIDYKPLQQKINALGAEKLILGENLHNEERMPINDLLHGYDHLKEIKFECWAPVSPDNITPNPQLEKISGKERISKPAEIIARLPNLVKMEAGNYDDEDELYEYLMTRKPKKLEKVNCVFEDPEKAVELLKKYPELLVSAEARYSGDKRYKKYEEYEELRDRNKLIREVVDGKDFYGNEVEITYAGTLNKLIESKGLAECLELMPAEKIPSFEKLCSSMEGFHAAIMANYGDDYDKVLAKVAGLTGNTDYKTESDLRQAISEDKVLEFLNGFAEDKRPNVSVLNGRMVNDVAPFTALSHKNKSRMELAAIIEAFKPSDKDLDDLSAACDKESLLHEMVEYVKSERKQTRDKETARARFAQWKAKNIRDDK